MQRQNRHEWRETIEGEIHLFRGIFYGSDWEITTCIRISRRETTEWETIENPPLTIWETLRDIVWRKYQRKRLPWRIVEDLDGIIADLGGSKKQDSTSSGA